MHCSGGDTASFRYFQGLAAVLTNVIGQADVTSHYNKDDTTNVTIILLLYLCGAGQPILCCHLLLRDGFSEEAAVNGWRPKGGTDFSEI